MNNDLINKSTLLEELKEKVYPEKFGERCNALDVIYAVLQVIDEQPIIYDVDKVVEQLNEARFPITDLKQGVKINGVQQTDDAVLYSRAIEIVKTGGIAEEYESKI